MIKRDRDRIERDETERAGTKVPSVSLDERLRGRDCDIELPLRDEEGRRHAVFDSTSMATRLRQIAVPGGRTVVALEPRQAESLARLANDTLFREAYGSVTRALGLEQPARPEAVEVAVVATTEDGDAFDITFRARLPKGTTLPTGTGNRPGPDGDLVMTLRVRSAELGHARPDFEIRDLSVEPYGPEIGTGRPRLDLDDTRQRASVTHLLTDQQVQDAIGSNNARFASDQRDQVDTVLSPSLIDRANKRRETRLQLTIGDIDRGLVVGEPSSSVDNPTVGHLRKGGIPPDTVRSVSRFLNDALFLEYYAHIVGALGLDPAPAPLSVDVSLVPRKNESGVVERYEISFQARLPEGTIVRGQGRGFRGNQCGLLLKTSVDANRIADEDPQLRIDHLAIAVHRETPVEQPPEGGTGVVRDRWLALPGLAEGAPVELMTSAGVGQVYHFPEHSERFEQDFDQQADAELALSLLARVRDRPGLMLRLTVGGRQLGVIQETHQAQTLLEGIASPGRLLLLSRFLHDGPFLEVYRLICQRRCDLDPPPDPRVIDVAIERKGNIYDITFRARMPPSLVFQGAQSFRGDRCDLVMTINVYDNQLDERQPFVESTGANIEVASSERLPDGSAGGDPTETTGNEIKPKAPELIMGDLATWKPVPVTGRLRGAGWVSAISENHRRLESDYRERDETTILAPSLISRVRDRGYIPLLFSKVLFSRRTYSLGAFGPDTPAEVLLGDIAPEQIRVPLSRFLHDGLFRDLYLEFCRQAGLDPPPDPQEWRWGWCRD